MAVVGGTASVLGGGKFANGAMSGAFVHLFNGEYGSIKKTFESIAKGLYRAGDYLARISGFRDWQNGSVILKHYYQEQAINQANEFNKFVNYAIDYPKLAVKAYSQFNDYRYSQLETDTVVKGYISSFTRGGIPLMISATGNILIQAQSLNKIIESYLP